jgi:hypothetical protein
MGHKINAFLGYDSTINRLAKNWSRDSIQLSQGLSMLFLTDNLFEDIVGLSNLKDEVSVEHFESLTPAIFSLLEMYSQNGKIAYFETDYFGGVGEQSAILFENGVQKFPIQYTNDFGCQENVKERAVNFVLKEFGVTKLEGQDEFDSIKLYNYRHMM